MLNDNSMIDTADYKSQSIRAIHLDLKGVPPTREYLMDLPKLFTAAGYNAVVVEWEDMFPWTVDERFRHESACYTAEDVRGFVEALAHEQIELIPLVQCLGHLENVLSFPGYEALREVPGETDVLNPLAKGAVELIGSMIEDILHLMPNVRWLHLGGDEAWTFGHHPNTQAFIAQHGKGALFLKHVEPLIERLRQRGICPLLWHDMMIDWSPEELRRIASQAEVVCWGYRGHPDHNQGLYQTKYIQRFHEHGVRLWGAAAFKGADGSDADYPDLMRRRENALAWYELAERFKFRGLIATGWSRYASHRGQCETLSASLDSMFMVGQVFSGIPDAEAESLAMELLRGTSSFDHFVSSREAAAWLTRSCCHTWDVVRRVRQQAYQEQRWPTRRCSATGSQLMEVLNAALDDVYEAGKCFRKVLSGAVVDSALKEYVEERYDFLSAEATMAEKMLSHARSQVLMTVVSADQQNVRAVGSRHELAVQARP